MTTPEPLREPPTRPALPGLRVVFFGMGGIFSRAPLAALLAAGVDLRAVVSPAPASISRAESGAPFVVAPSAARPPARALPLLSLAPVGGVGEMATRTVAQMAAEAGAPYLSVTRLSDPRTLAALAAFDADAFCVACFTRRLPAALLALPRLGCLNAHPSLLPDNRGPDPLFWTFHAGASHTGVTLHLMDAALDTGPILLRQRVRIEEGETEARLEARLARVAGDLMVRALGGLASGALTPFAQDDTQAAAHSWPGEDDYTIQASWSARRAYAFARGVGERGAPIGLIAADGARFRLIEPLGYDAAGALAQPWRFDGEQLALRCAPGTFTCRAAPECQ